MRYWAIQLADHVTGKAITASGGVAMAVTAGGSAKVAVATSSTGTPATSNNPVSLTNGKIEFWTADSVSTVDLYVACPGGQFLVAKTVVASGPNELFVDTNQRNQTMVIPFDQSDFTANSESDTGFDEPASAIMLPTPAVRVTTVDATETISVGTDSGDSGDADGFMATVSIATAGVVVGTIANGANTLGALFEVQDSANSGDLTHEGHVSGGKSITMTTSAGADTGVGFIILPYILTGA